MADGEWTDREKYVFKRTLEELGSYRGMGTQLVTLYIPPTRQISDAAGMLRDELGQASNIKSKATQTAVSSALTSMLARLKNYRHTPETGLALFVGEVSVGGNKSKQVAVELVPPEPVQTYLYRCDSTFNIEPLEGMGQTEDVYGLLVIDRKEVSIGLLRGKSIVHLHNKDSLVPSKHGRGGQSQRRFERLTEEIAHQWFVGCAEKANDYFLHEKNLKAVLVGGPGPTKEFFVSENFLHHEVQKKVYGTCFDTGYTDLDQGLKELVENASVAIQGLGMVEEKHLIQRFLKETGKMDGGLGEYGEGPVRMALEMGAVDHLLLSEDLRKVRCTYRNTRTGEEKVKLVDQHKVALESDKIAKEWGGNNYELKEEDLIENLSDIAESQGTNVHIVSSASEEGGIMKNAFGGIIAILRYQYR